LTARSLDPRGAILGGGALAIGVGFLSARSPLLTLGLLGASILVLLAVTRPAALLLVLVAVLPWEERLRYPTETVSVVKLLGALVLAAFLLKALQRGSRLRLPPIAYAVGAFVLLVCVSLIFSSDPAAGTGTLLRYLLFAGLFFLILQLVDDEEGLTRVLRVITLSATAAAVWGLIPFLAGSAERASGPIGDPNDFGYLMATVLPLAGYLAVADRRFRPLWLTAFPILLAGMLATLSRGVIVALIALFAWLLLTRRVRVGGLALSATALVAVLAAALLLFSPLIGERLEQRGKSAEANVDSREALWRGAVLMAMDNPVVGVGPGQFGTQSTDYVRDLPVVLENPVVHNTYLEILAENGLPALAAFTAFLVGAWLSLSATRRRARASGDERLMQLATAVQGSLLVAAVGALFLSQQLATPFWLIGALAALIPRIAGLHRPSVEPPGAGVRRQRATVLAGTG
jgi:O-antigen ligase